jgi:hypothetical protein
MASFGAPALSLGLRNRWQQTQEFGRRSEEALPMARHVIAALDISGG